LRYASSRLAGLSPPPARPPPLPPPPPEVSPGKARVAQPSLGSALGLRRWLPPRSFLPAMRRTTAARDRQKAVVEQADSILALWARSGAQFFDPASARSLGSFGSTREPVTSYTRLGGGGHLLHRRGLASHGWFGGSRSVIQSQLRVGKT
jgi:hypothetical protein